MFQLFLAFAPTQQAEFQLKICLVWAAQFAIRLALQLDSLTIP